MTDLKDEIFITHQTGALDFAAIKEAYAALPFAAEVTPFIEAMDGAYAKADLVLCRAGATTVAELTAFGKAAVLVPYPYAIYDHQRGNAQALQEQGAAEMILDQDLDGKILAEKLRGYLSDRARITRIAAAARALGRPDAAARIVDECYALARGNRIIQGEVRLRCNPCGAKAMGPCLGHARGASAHEICGEKVSHRAKHPA